MSIINGMTRAAHALTYWERRQEIASNNLANADTHGFKAERVFARIIGEALPFADTATDLGAGALKQTNNSMDLALGGDGFFVVQTPQGERFTRAGAFRLDTEGRLVDAQGNAVLGEGGPIVVPPGQFGVDGKGVVSVDGREIGRLRIENVAPGVEMAHEGGTFLVPDPATRAPVPPENVTVRQGYLEDSNVSTVDSMVDLISIQRSYAAVQRTITTLDSIRQTIANDLGRPVS